MAHRPTQRIGSTSRSQLCFLCPYYNAIKQSRSTISKPKTLRHYISILFRLTNLANEMCTMPVQQTVREMRPVQQMIQKSTCPPHLLQTLENVNDDNKAGSESGLVTQLLIDAVTSFGSHNKHIPIFFSTTVPKNHQHLQRWLRYNSGNLLVLPQLELATTIVCLVIGSEYMLI